MSRVVSPESALIENNLGLVHACCHKLTGRGIEYEELYGAGCLGLCKAAKGFDKSRGLCFSTYAVPVILGEIRRLFRDGGSVRVSRSLKELWLKIVKKTAVLEKSLHRSPTVQELAEALGVSEERIAEAVCAARPVLSLTAGEDGEEGQFDLPIDSGEEDFCDKYTLRQVLAALPERDRLLITYRYLQGKTQSATAALLGMTQVQVSRRERVILQTMREQFI